MQKDWRNSKLFRFGYLPLRLVFTLIAIAALGIAGACAYPTWFQASDAKRFWREIS